MADFVNVKEYESTKIINNLQQNVVTFSGKLKIGYVYSPALLKECDRVPNLIERVHINVNITQHIQNFIL